MSIEVDRSHQKQIKVETVTATGNRITVSHFLWMARELQKAVDEEGLDDSAQVHLDNPHAVQGSRLWVNHTQRTNLP